MPSFLSIFVISLKKTISLKHKDLQNIDCYKDTFSQDLPDNLLIFSETFIHQ